MLLTDGTGALFNARSDASLRAGAVAAIENLRLPGLIKPKRSTIDADRRRLSRRPPARPP